MEIVEDKDNVATTAENLEFIKNTAVRTTDKINYRESIRNFAGLRANPDCGDFIVGEAKDVKGFIDAAGMKSPGLSSAPAVALDVVEILKNSGLKAELKNNFKNTRKQINFMELSSEKKAELIKKDSRYGKIICRCESITEGEIIDSIKRSFGKVTLDGVKRRCRPGMGRCQGGFCGPRVQEIIARELNVPMEDIVQESDGSYILIGRTK